MIILFVWRNYTLKKHWKFLTAVGTRTWDLPICRLWPYRFGYPKLEIFFFETCIMRVEENSNRLFMNCDWEAGLKLHVHYQYSRGNLFTLQQRFIVLELYFSSIRSWFVTVFFTSDIILELGDRVSASKRGFRLAWR